MSTIISLLSYFEARRARIATIQEDELLAAYLSDVNQRVSQSLAQEAARNKLYPPYLEAIRWEATNQRNASGISDAGKRSFKRGKVQDLPRLFRALPTRQLLVLGSPGSGKSSTALQLARELMPPHGKGNEPVPVLLNMASWNPRLSLEKWLIRNLAIRYPSRSKASSRRLAKIAVMRKRILPVLDGFDEISKSLQPQALQALKDDLGLGMSVIFTCRTEAFDRLVGDRGLAPTRISVIQLQPLTPAQVARRLKLDFEEDWWRVVRQHIEDAPESDLARVLCNPLMLHLAQDTFSEPGTDPRAMLSKSPGEVEGIILGAYVPAMYSQRMSRLDDTLKAYSLPEASRYLKFIARGMNRENSVTVSWWNLITFDVIGYRTFRIAIFLAAFLPFALRYGLLVGAVVGLLARWLIGGPSKNARPPRPLAIGKRNITVFGTVGLAVGIGSTVALAPALGVLVGTLAGLAFAVTIFLSAYVIGSARVREDEYLSPSLLFTRDRNALIVGVFGISLISATRSALQWGLGLGVQQLFRSIVLLLVVGSIAGVCTSALRFLWAQAALRARGAAPAPFLDFLEDACTRGIMRRDGGSYQFRHLELRDYLCR